MNQRIDAIFENGVFRPELPVNIPDGERVSLQVESRYVVDDDLADVAHLLDGEFMEDCRRRVRLGSGPSLAGVRAILSKFQGSLADDIAAERDERDMARYFLDSSALAKRYHAEIGTPVVDALFADAGNQLLASRLAIVEVHSSFARRFREGILSSVELTELIEMLEADVATGLITIVAVTNRRLDDASILLRTHGLNLNVRTLDAIHLATAQAFSIASPATIFAAADKKLLAVASAACGLTVLDVG